MAIYRLHKKDWERASGQIPGPKHKQSTEATRLEGFKAVLQSMLDEQRIEEKPPTSNMHRKKRAKTRKGVSSELSIIVGGEEDRKSIEL